MIPFTTATARGATMDELTLRALIGSVSLAAALGPLGSFVVWRHMAYFGDTVAHAALLGVAISLLALPTETLRTVGLDDPYALGIGVFSATAPNADRSPEQRSAESS